MNKDKVVLSFHESLLRESDLEILKGPRWLNDILISFYFEYLEIEKFKNNKQLLFISPEVTQCIKISSVSEISIFLDPLSADSKDFIFFALNDNVRTDCSGGSHWSLLVFSKPERTLFHFDSHVGSNYTQAKDFGFKLLKYFDLIQQGRIIEADCLQQSNGYDCGVHVLCNVEHVAKHCIQKNRVEGCGMLDSHKVLNKRTEFLDLVKKLKKIKSLPS